MPCRCSWEGSPSRRPRPAVPLVYVWTVGVGGQQQHPTRADLGGVLHPSTVGLQSSPVQGEDFVVAVAVT